ncbi:ATP-binding protein [Belliella aquatica]|uniref:ATPase AAA n=1 Tax=Belliella aquatica TaxID=1323734 RepID=A0ABQ1LS02_9BACT|nr:AAA family ATPase [Belliella aquatica]MCH7404382.1 AAA family ATPase [Belliella aquatica]GGC27587.1 ATPase AAA [Belliella aquatica]
MEELLKYQGNLLKNFQSSWYRYLFKDLLVQERLLGIKGLRGVGKTTLLLQHLKEILDQGEKGLYVTAEHPYFYNQTLFELASLWYSYGGKVLLVDEIHKYPDWSRELKLIYDGFPELRIIFTSSSALDLYRGEADLSRRLETQILHGLSFREYLSLYHQISLEPIDFQDIIENTLRISDGLIKKIGVPVLPLFKEYLQAGYFPFTKELKAERIPQRLIQIINTVLESDLSAIQGYSASNVIKIKQLLGVIAESVPFEPNISKIAEKMHLGRQTVNIYIKHLEDAKILNLLYEQVKGISQLQKPGKIYFENSNFLFSLQMNPSSGTVRETFFMNQLRNSGRLISLSKKGDFLVDEKYTFEIGGRNKDKSQIKNVENSFLALDDLEYGIGSKIPLWLFGFLY